MVLAYKQGDPKCHRDPDALVAKGVDKHPRHSFLTWKEGVVPCVLFEISSKGTWRVDLYKKPAVYASIGVKEYFLYDSEGCYLDPVLQGFRTIKGKPVPMRPAKDGSLVSKQLGLRLVPQGEMLRLFVLATEEPILTSEERIAQARQQYAAAVNQRVVALTAELAHLRAKMEWQKRNA